MTNRTALVTGATGGIGSVICNRLLADGLLVRAIDVVGSPDFAVDLAADPIPPDAVADADICVCVAGVVDTFAPAHSMSSEKWSRDIDINLTGSFHAIQACLPGMRERRFGRVVAIASTRGRTGSPGMIATPKVLTLAEHDQDRIREAIPTRRFGEPGEVASLVAFPRQRERRIHYGTRHRHCRRT